MIFRERDKQILEGFANMYDSYSFEAVMCDLECAQETGDSDVCLILLHY